MSRRRSIGSASRSRRCVFIKAALKGRETPELADADWTEVGVGHSWQDAEAAAWLRGRFTVPESWAGERVGLWIEIKGAEPLLFLDGQPAQALDYNHQDMLLYESAAGGEAHTFAIEAYAPSRGGVFEIRAADLVRVDRTAYALFHDMAVAVEALDILPENSREYQGLLLGLDAAMNALDYTQSGAAASNSDAFYASLSTAREALRDAFYDTFPADAAREPAMTLSGHAHIDVAWLWTLENTRKKCGRTFATALRLMDEFPEYVFTQSQPQLYQYARERYPALYEQIKERVAEGRWEVTGGMWVEADCNVPGGESLIRQILFGNRFFQREFGKTTRVLWLPDVFGYPAALPQIIRGCGMEYFLTTKISWSQFNRMPADTFTWRGIDGTEVLTHFVTTPESNQRFYTYNGQMTAREVRGAWDEYRQKDVNDELLNLFGFGDGGGGPTRRMIEAGRRFSSLAGFPRCAFGGAEAYFDRLAARVNDNPLLPRWVGELYLEYHRGTYTSQARMKKANRRSEILYHNAELFSALALVELETAYSGESLNAGWERILLNQFHDILPGSSIAPVYEEAARDYAEAARIGGEALNGALDALAGAVDVRRDSVVLFNPTDTLRAGDAVRVTLPADLGDVEFTDAANAPVPAPLLSEAEGERTYLVSVSSVAPMGYDTLTVYRAGGPPEASTVWAELAEAPPAPNNGRPSPAGGAGNAPAVLTSGSPSPTAWGKGQGGGGQAATLENEYVRVTLDAAGEIASLIHKLPGEGDEVVEREVIAPGSTGNALVLFEDKPLRYDAWDIDIFYQSKAYALRDIGTVESMAVVEDGPVRAGIEVRRRFLKSSLTQRIFLYAHSARVEFETEVDWQERQMLLKAAFPVAVNAARATYEIQFGVVERPTHANTSWDWARFEVCGHKWADLSEGDYGVSLLNDSKYGYDIRDNVLRLTLLKGAIAPDPGADLGQHSFTYALLPHDGDWRMETVDEAYALNYPLLSRFVPARGGGMLPTSYTFATVDDTRVIIETVKKAEDGDGIVIRLYEAMNTRGTATLTLGFEISAAFAVNLVEENPTAVPHTRNTLTFEYRPFEIKTFLVTPRR